LDTFTFTHVRGLSRFPVDACLCYYHARVRAHTRCAHIHHTLRNTRVFPLAPRCRLPCTTYALPRTCHTPSACATHHTTHYLYPRIYLPTAVVTRICYRCLPALPLTLRLPHLHTTHTTTPAPAWYTRCIAHTLPTRTARRCAHRTARWMPGDGRLTMPPRYRADAHTTFAARMQRLAARTPHFACYQTLHASICSSSRPHTCLPATTCGNARTRTYLLIHHLFFACYAPFTLPCLPATYRLALPYCYLPGTVPRTSTPNLPATRCYIWPYRIG